MNKFDLNLNNFHRAYIGYIPTLIGSEVSILFLSFHR
jgi:hypothetical protein